MKKLLILACMLWSVVANAQFTPGQVLTAAELNSQFALYAPIAGATFSGPVATTSTVNSTTPSTGSITTLGGLGVAQDVFVGGSIHGAAYITAGNISSTPISGSTGSFTTLSASGTVTLPTGSLPLTNLATQAANTIVANGTGSTASPTAISAPSCSTTSSALQWASGSGLACNTAINAASLGGSTFASPGSIGSTTAGTGTFTSLSSTGTFTPSQTNGIVGTTTNNNANAGSVGEYISSTGTAVSLTTATPTVCTSVSLTAGDWDVDGSLAFAPAATTTVTQVAGGLNTVNTSLPSAPFSTVTSATLTTGQNEAFRLPSLRESLATTTTIYLIAQSSFGTSTMTATCLLRARRAR